MSSVFQESDYNMAVCSDIWWQNGHRKPLRTAGKSHQSHNLSCGERWTRVKEWWVSCHPGKPKLLCGSMNPSIPRFYPVETTLTQEIHIHTDIRCESGLCSMSLVTFFLLSATSWGTQLLSRNRIKRSCVRTSKTAVWGQDMSEATSSVLRRGFTSTSSFTGSTFSSYLASLMMFSSEAQKSHLSTSGPMKNWCCNDVWEYGH